MGNYTNSKSRKNCGIVELPRPRVSRGMYEVRAKEIRERNCKHEKPAHKPIWAK